MKKSVRFVGGLAWALVVVSAGGAASAQGAPAMPRQSAVDVQNYWPAAGPSQNVALRSSEVSPHLSLGFGLLANFMYQPLVFRTAGAMPQSFHAVNFAATTDFVWNLGLFERFQLGLAIPIVIAQEGVGLSPLNPTAGSLPLTAVRDLRFELSWAVVRRERTTNASGFGLRVDLGAALPTGDSAGFQGAPTATFAPMVVADYRVAGLTITANVGARVREAAAVARVAWASQLYAGLGVAYRPTMFNRLAFGVDYQALVPLYGTIDVAGNAGITVPHAAIMPMELFFGARYAVDRGRDIEVSLGGGAPLTGDATNPAFRVMAGVSYAPRGTDDDRDGVIDANDRCPAQAEDRDGFEDDDGCPDPDNDNDGVLDTSDRCPNEPEDVDNFSDEDGCPEPDNDNDNVPDGDDECATESAGERPDPAHPGCPVRDRDGDRVLDADDQCVDTPAGALPDPQRRGCPTPDRDRDNVGDEADACPDDPAGAHPDAFRAGCPDPDRDHDGVANEVDRCVDEPETINGVTDDDGCADEGEERVSWAGPVLVFQNAVRLPARLRRLRPQETALFVQAAQRVRSRGSAVRSLRVEVVPAPGAAGQREAERLANLVLEVLVANNVPRGLLTAAAWAPPAAPPAADGAPARPARPARPVAQPVGEVRIRAELLRRPGRPERRRAAEPAPANAATPANTSASPAPPANPCAPASPASPAANPCAPAAPAANPCAPASPASPAANPCGAR